MKNYKNIFLGLFVFSAFLTSCTNDFEEINTNNNNPESVAPQFLLTNVISVSADLNAYNQVNLLYYWFTRF